MSLTPVCRPRSGEAGVISRWPSSGPVVWPYLSGTERVTAPTDQGCEIKGAATRSYLPQEVRSYADRRVPRITGRRAMWTGPRPRIRRARPHDPPAPSCGPRRQLPRHADPRLGLSRPGLRSAGDDRVLLRVVAGRLASRRPCRRGPSAPSGLPDRHHGHVAGVVTCQVGTALAARTEHALRTKQKGAETTAGRGLFQGERRWQHTIASVTLRGRRP